VRQEEASIHGARRAPRERQLAPSTCSAADDDDDDDDSNDVRGRSNSSSSSSSSSRRVEIEMAEGAGVCAKRRGFF
jgi:hypothetical protein